MIVRLSPEEVILFFSFLAAIMPEIKSTTVSTITVISVALMGINTIAIEAKNAVNFCIRKMLPSQKKLKWL
jgi:hypothetical protein